MKVKVITRLNKRLLPATKNTPLGVPHIPNDILDILEVVEGEVVYPGNNKWYKTSNGYYVYSGGVALLPGQPENLLTTFDWWHEKFKISAVWDTLQTKGEGVKIAVLDSGVALDHPALIHQKGASGKDYSNTSYNEDTYVHGTSVAGIIFAKNQVSGIAPNAELYVVKLFDTGIFHGRTLLQAVKDLPSEIQIVVISQALVRAQFPADLDEEFNKLAAAKMIVCAVGNYSNHSQSTWDDYYPGALANCFTVAACNSNDLIYEASAKSKHIDICAPGVNMKVLQPGGSVPYTDSGTSYAAPFVAGILALMSSYGLKTKKEFNNDKLKRILVETVGDKTKNKLLYGNGIINPIAATEKLLI